jgi:hypothetical protein
MLGTGCAPFLMTVLDNTTTQRLICSDWETFVPGLAIGTKGATSATCGPFVPGLAIGTKGATSATWLAHPFIQVGVTNWDKRSFFPVFLFSIFFYFNYTFAFQLNLCIGIQCV